MVCIVIGLKTNTKSEILTIFADFDSAPDKHGDPLQHPIFLRLGDMKREHGGAMRKSLQAAITETEYRMACVSGIQFLGELPGSESFLADIAVKHDDDWYRSAAVEALEYLGEREVLRSIYDDVPATDRKHVGMALAFMDADAVGCYGPLVSQLIRGKHPGKRWDEAKDRLGEAKAFEIVALIRDHPQLPDSVRQAVRDVYLELRHGR